MSNERYDAINNIVRQSAADMRHLSHVMMDFHRDDALVDREDALVNGAVVEGYEASQREDDYKLVARANNLLCSHSYPDEARLLLDMIRQRVAALPVEITE